MTTYTCHWIEKSPGRQGAAPLAVQATLVPHGYDGRAFFQRHEARTSSRRFRMVQDLAFAEQGGPQAVLQQLVALRRALADAGFEEIVVPETVYAPGSVQGWRPKTADECRMELAVLHTECGDADTALALLHACGDSGRAWYWHTAARRAHAHRARTRPGPGADADWDAALTHAQFIIDSAAQQGMADVYRMDTGAGGYHFGDSYRGAPPQLAAATQTLAEYCLCIAGEPAQALQAIALCDCTSSGTRQMEQFRVTALLQLGRSAEAYATHLRWRLQMPDVLQDPAYRAYVAREQAQALQAERQRVSALKFDYAPGPSPATPADIEALRQQFPAVLLNPACAGYVNWISQPGQPRQLSVVDGEARQDYVVFSVEQALAKRDELLGWLRLHERSAPELAEEIWQAILADGIQPLQMLPIVGEADASDCFVLRTEGPGAGTVYFWAHDECAVFTPIVPAAEQLFAELRTRAEQGCTLVL